MDSDGARGPSFVPSASLGITAIYAIPIGYALNLLTSLKQEHLQGISTYYIVLGAVLLSTLFSLCSYLLPRSIRSRTSVPAFLLWFLLAASFSLSAGFYDNLIGLGLSVTLALLILIFLVFYFHLRDLLLDSGNENESEESNVDHGNELLMKQITATVFTLACTVALFTVPVLAVAGNNFPRTANAISGLHSSAFLFWLLVALLGATEKQESKV